MGVDAGISIRVFQNDSGKYKEIVFAGDTNSFGSLFYNAEIQYTSIQFNLESEITEEEYKLFRLQEEDDEGMVCCSNIIDADLAVKTFDKIYRRLYTSKVEALNNDLNTIYLLDINPEEKNQQINSKISEYLNFENTFGEFVGILKTANAFGNKIQIIAEFY